MASHLATAGGYNTPRDMQDRVRRESSTSKRAKMGPGSALELKFQNPFKGRPESVTHFIRQAPRRPGQTHQVDIYVTHGLSRVKEPSGAPSTTKTTTKKHQELDPLWPPWTRQLSEWRPTRPPGNPTTMEGIRPQRVATASRAEDWLRKQRKEFAYEGGAGKPLDEYRRRTNEDGPASPDTVVSLPCIPSMEQNYPWGEEDTV